MRLINADAFSAFIRDAVIKHKYDRLNIDNTLTVADVLQSVCAELDGTGLEGFKNAPTVDAVPVKHGRWKMVEGELVFWDMCSVCGRKILHRTPYYDFCPNCGADMRKGGDTDGV